MAKKTLQEQIEELKVKQGAKASNEPEQDEKSDKKKAKKEK